MGEKTECDHCHKSDVDVDGIAFDADKFDIVIVEQVLEHLSNPGLVLKEIGRVLQRDGLLIVGVPIHLPIVAFLCPYVLPIFDKLTGTRRTYEQVFSYRSFMRLVSKVEYLCIQKIRGFRIVSGGPFALLENFCWWYKLNIVLGRAVPWLCPEVQVVCKAIL